MRYFLVFVATKMMMKKEGWWLWSKEVPLHMEGTIRALNWEAENEETAKKEALESLLKIMPVSEGWHSHHCVFSKEDVEVKYKPPVIRRVIEGLDEELFEALSGLVRAKVNPKSSPEELAEHEENLDMARKAYKALEELVK